jgi:hypothetical protein
MNCLGLGQPLLMVADEPRHRRELPDVAVEIGNNARHVRFEKLPGNLELAAYGSIDFVEG